MAQGAAPDTSAICGLESAHALQPGAAEDPHQRTFHQLGTNSVPIKNLNSFEVYPMPPNMAKKTIFLST